MPFLKNGMVLLLSGQFFGVKDMNLFYHLLLGETTGDLLTMLLDVVESDPELRVRHELLAMLMANPPFKKREDHPLANEALVERIWKLMK